MEEYTKLEAEKVRRRGQTFSREIATLGEFRYYEDIDYFKEFDTDFSAIVFNDMMMTNHKISLEPTVNPLDENQIDFRISFDESDDEDYTDEANAIFRGENDQVIQELCNSFVAIYKVKSTRPHSTTPVHSGIPNVINTGPILYINIVSNGRVMNEVPLSYATKLSPTSLTKTNLRKLEVNVPNDVYYDVWLTIASVHELNDRMNNSLYGYSIGKRLALLVVEWFVRSNWENYGFKRVTMVKGFCLFKFSSIEGVDSLLRDGCNKESSSNKGNGFFSNSFVALRVESLIIKEVAMGNMATTSSKLVLVDDDENPLENVDYLGNGRIAFAWFDKWSENCPLFQHVSARLIKWDSFSLSNLVFDVIIKGVWSWPNQWPIKDEVDWGPIVWFSNFIPHHAFLIHSWEDIVNWIKPLSCKRSVINIVACLVIAATAYFIWHERNIQLFKNQSRMVFQVRNIIVYNVRLKMLTYGFKKTKNVEHLLAIWNIALVLGLIAISSSNSSIVALICVGDIRFAIETTTNETICVIVDHIGLIFYIFFKIVSSRVPKIEGNGYTLHTIHVEHVSKMLSLIKHKERVRVRIPLRVNMDSESDMEEMYDENAHFRESKGTKEGSGFRNKSLYEVWKETMDDDEDDPYDDDEYNTHGLSQKARSVL
nr:hypothetical protein [Tanacetum cinerariifolium]